MPSAATDPPSAKLTRFNSWSYVALGTVAVGLVAYLASTWHWLYSDEVALRNRILYWALLAFLSCVGFIHFFAAHLLARKVLVEACDSDPMVLRGFGGQPTAELSGRARTLRVAPQITGTGGTAYVIHLSSGWYLAVASAAEAVKQYKSGRAAGEA